VSAVAALTGWTVAGLAGVLAVVAWRRLRWRLEFVARACHELRGPLTAVRLGVELAARKGELAAGRLRAIDLELARAALVLDDLSTGGRGSGAAPAREQVDVEQLLVDSVEAWRASAAVRNVTLELDWCGERVYVGGERLRLAQATGNLIANAIEHGGGVVAVHGRVSGENLVRIEVVDDGPGLPAPVAELARRPHAGRGRRGRGLAIALGVAQAHGGRLAAAPSERGARLVLELPVSGGAPARAPVAGYAPGRGRRLVAA
jgi:signal transduction histidine kinase